jgi:hypothetical protein
VRLPVDEDDGLTGGLPAQAATTAAASWTGKWSAPVDVEVDGGGQGVGVERADDLGEALQY